MRLSISNIAWEASDDADMYEILNKHGFDGVEIAPTRIFPESPYDRLEEAASWASDLKERYHLAVPSMQSIWYGRREKLFGTDEERAALFAYTVKAIDFAAATGCRNLVFGCPVNRAYEEGADLKSAVTFFGELGDYAVRRGTVIGMEANPPIYNTNYINDTISALHLIEEVGSEGFKLNLDIGTMIANGERTDELIGNVRFINHVHISEPRLAPIEHRALHKEIAKVLKAERYDGFVSIEMGKGLKMQDIEAVMDYVKGIFYDI